MPLSLTSSIEEFNRELLDTYGIKSNTIEIADCARAAKAGGSQWHDFCEMWGQAPGDLAGLRNRLCKLKPATRDTPPPRPRAEVSPSSKEKLAEFDQSKTGAPSIFNAAKGPVLNVFTGKEKPLPPVAGRSLLDRLKREPMQAPKSSQPPKQAPKSKADAAALAARTIHVKKPQQGWLVSPHTKLAAANWRLIEALLGMTRTTDANESFIEFVLSEEQVQELKKKHDFDMVAVRAKNNKGDVRAALCSKRAVWPGTVRRRSGLRGVRLRSCVLRPCEHRAGCFVRWPSWLERRRCSR
jgi:hypothetical protein